MPTPYIPPQTPPPVYQPGDVNQKQQQELEQFQKQQQEQKQNQVVNNNPSESSNSNNLKNDVRSAPEAEITQTQSSSLNNYQINSQAESAWVKFSNSTTVPVPQLYFNTNYNRSDFGSSDSDSNINFNAGITIPLGGKAKSLAFEEVEVNTIARVLSICNTLGYFEGKVDIDFEVRPELADCQGVNPVKVSHTPPTRSAEIDLLRQQLEESRKRQEQLEKAILMLNRRQIDRESNKPSRVGG